MSKLLVPYLTAGFPEKSWFEPLVRAFDAAGADVIEIGVPFSDPIADGPTIQHASQVALDQGVSCRWILEEISRFGKELRAKLLFFSYYNPFNALGTLAEAAAKLKRAGFYGVLIPDLSLEQAAPLVQALRAEDLHFVPLIAPTTPVERLQRVAPLTTSFAYGVSVTGVTGARLGVAKGLDEYLDRVKTHLKRDFVVGFGVASPEDAAEISRVADGVVVGSALVKMIAESSSCDEAVARCGDFISSLRKSIDKG